MTNQTEVYGFLSVRLRQILEKIDKNISIREIRLRVNMPIILNTDEGEIYVNQNGERCLVSNGVSATTRDIKETLEYISNYSLYAYEEEIKNGFITMPGGNRVGICGRTVCDNNGIKTIRNISFVNIRIAHQVVGCSDEIMDKLYEKNTFCHTLIVSPPGCGKTTLLRDIIRNLSNGFFDHKGVTVGVSDERSEIAACNMGIAQNDIGIRTDVMDACPKSIGMLLLIRSMAPRVIAVDEIGDRKDVEAIKYCINCGCKMLATVHACSIEELYEKKELRELIADGVFERFVLLKNAGKPGIISGIYDKGGRLV